MNFGNKKIPSGCQKVIRTIKNRGNSIKKRSSLYCERLFNSIDKKSKNKISIVSKISKYLQRYNKQYRKKSDPESSSSSLNVEIVSNNDSSRKQNKEEPSINEEPDFIKKFIGSPDYLDIIKKYRFLSFALVFLVIILSLWFIYYSVFSVNSSSLSPLSSTSSQDNINNENDLMDKYDLGWMNALNYEKFLIDYVDSFTDKSKIYQTPISTKESLIEEERDKNVWWWYHAHISSSSERDLKGLHDLVSRSCRPLSQSEIDSSKLNLCTSLSSNSNRDEEDCVTKSDENNDKEGGGERVSSMDLTLLYDILCHEAKRKSITKMSRYNDTQIEERGLKELMEYSFPRTLNVEDFTMSLNNPEGMFYPRDEIESDKWWNEYKPPDVCVMAVYKPLSKSSEDHTNFPKKLVKNFLIPNISMNSDGSEEHLLFNNSYNPPKNAFIHASKERGFSTLKRRRDNKMNDNSIHGFEEMIGQTDYTAYEPGEGRCSVWINPEIKIIHKDSSDEGRYKVKYDSSDDEGDIDENHYQVMHGIEYFKMPIYDNDKSKIAMNEGYEINKFLTTIEKDIAVSYHPMSLPFSYNDDDDKKTKDGKTNIFHGSYLWIPDSKINTISAQLNVAMMQGKIDVMDNNKKARKKISSR